MFDFEKLDLYQHLKELSAKTVKFAISDEKCNLKKKMQECCLKSILDLAKASNILDSDTRINLLLNSRQHIFESVAILDILLKVEQIDVKKYEEFYADFEKASKMLLGMYKSILK